VSGAPRAIPTNPGLVVPRRAHTAQRTRRPDHAAHPTRDAAGPASRRSHPRAEPSSITFARATPRSTAGPGAGGRACLSARVHCTPMDRGRNHWSTPATRELTARRRTRCPRVRPSIPLGGLGTGSLCSRTRGKSAKRAGCADGTHRFDGLPDRVRGGAGASSAGGRSLEVLGFSRRRGVLHLLLVLPDGSRSLIPAAWTDLEPADAAVQETVQRTRAPRPRRSSNVKRLQGPGPGRPTISAERGVTTR
jgi:hypothetical protein